MDNRFWLDRWRQNQIGFHQPDINPYLEEYWSETGLSPGESVFVPLCGKSRDMHWLAELGHPVLGVEVSPIAVDAFYEEQHITPKVIRKGHFNDYRSDQVQILCGDYFDLTAEDLMTVRGVFDRASLIAFPEALRRDYVNHLCAILNPGSPILLITLEYPPEEMVGPPFSVDAVEVHALFEPLYAVECLHRESVLDQNPHFQARGLSRLIESAYRLNYRA